MCHLISSVSRSLKYFVLLFLYKFFLEVNIYLLRKAFRRLCSCLVKRLDSLSTIYYVYYFI